MDDQNRNLILATVLSFGVILAWTTLFPPENLETTLANEVAVAAEEGTLPAADPVAPAATTPTEETTPASEAPRIPIATDELTGSISLLGGRIDDLALTQYRETIDEDADIVRLLRPVGERGAYFATFGWTATDGIAASAVPGPDTLWSLETGETLTPSTPVTLSWDNGAGQIFRTEIAVDDRFMFTFTQSVENTGAAPVAARPYGLLRRHGQPDDLKNFFILHEGLVRMTDGELEETGYDDITEYAVDERERTQAERLDVQTSGWIGYTDHYWMTTLIPDQSTPFRSTSKYFDSRDLFQAEAVMPIETIAPAKALP